MTSLIAIDPGVRKSGFAHFVNDVLVFAVLVTVDPPLGTTQMKTAELMAREFVDRIRHLKPSRIVIEKPQEYATDREVLADVRAVAHVVECLEAWLSIDTVTPNAWKAQLPKPVHHARVKRVLSPAELHIFDNAATHDVRDAIALGLWASGRVKRGGVPWKTK